MKKYERLQSDIFESLQEEELTITLVTTKWYIAFISGDKITLSPWIRKNVDDGIPGTPATSLLHEMIHFVRPKWSEEQIIKASSSTKTT